MFRSAVLPSEAVQVKTPPTAASKPVMVFGTDLAGSHESETATLAVRLWGAEPGVGSGETGFAYALPFRSTTGGLLGPDVISNYVETLRHRMEVQPDTIFQILRFGCEKDAHDDATMAKYLPTCRPTASYQVCGGDNWILHIPLAC